jgi:hypothetical protein
VNLLRIAAAALTTAICSATLSANDRPTAVTGTFQLLVVGK